MISREVFVFLRILMSVFNVGQCGIPGTPGPLGGSPYSPSLLESALKSDGSAGESGTFQPAPYALSSVYLKDLAEREIQVHDRVLDYLRHLEDRIDLVKTYLKDFDESNAGVEIEEGLNNLNLTTIESQIASGDSLGVEERALRVTASPLRSYRMIRRFAYDFRDIEKHIRDDAEATFLDQLAELQGNYNWPAEDDTNDVMDGILRIHFFYKLNLTEFVEGKVDGLETGAKFTTRQCWEMAQFAIRWQFYTLAMEWLQVTRWKLSLEREEDRWPGLSEDIIAAAERRTREHHDKNFDGQRENRSPFIYTTPIGNGPGLPVTMREYLFANYLGREWGEHSDYSFINYVALCNGHNFQNEEEKNKLKCWLERDKHPYFKLNPLKMELLHEEPYLVQVYDFIGDHWINVLKRVATPMLERAPPRTNARATPRTATYAWLPDESIEEIAFIKKTEAFTGLKVANEKTSERLQIASYTFGGHVGTHVDSLGSSSHLDEKGDRIFTLLVYLNDVDRGGLTAFPILGTTVKPLKGSAVLWYDSLKNGEVDGRMLHGACPLICGQKWIATKWTHLNENMFKWPCSLNSEE